MQFCNQKTQGDGNYGFVGMLSSPITHTFAIMIDKFIVQIPLGPVSSHHYECLAEVSYARFLHAKTKPTTTYIDTPVTGAQAEIRYEVMEVAGRKMGYLEITVALASCMVGHNLIHAGLASIRYEIRCAAALVRVILATLKLTQKEIEKGMIRAKFKLVELTWHTLTASEKARISAQRRTIAVMKAQRRASRRHDVQIKDVDVRDKNDKLGLLVELKSGTALRQYGKADMPYARSRRGRQHNFVQAGIAASLGAIKEVLPCHLRNEVILTEQMLGELALLKPKSWNPASVKRAIDAVWKDLGLTRGASGGSTSDVELSDSAQETLDRYNEGTLLLADLPGHRVTRDRKEIREGTGIDIEEPRGTRKAQIASVGRQLSYGRHWEPKDHFRDLVVCERTAPALITDLEQGLRFLLDGELPDFASKEEFAAWFKRWNAYALREHLKPLVEDDPDESWQDDLATDQSNSQESPPLPPRPWGIGTVPVFRNGVDDDLDRYFELG